MDRPPRRNLDISLTVATCAFILLLGLIGWALSPTSLRPRLVDAVHRATGRTLTIAGRMRIDLSLEPTISLEDVTLSNPTGANPTGANPTGSDFSRRNMVKIARVELTVGLLPLLEHRIEVSHVTLVRPDILLETDKSGRRNWIFERSAQRAETAPPAEAVPAEAAEGDTGSAEREKFAVWFKEVDVEDGRFGWNDGRTGKLLTADVTRLTVTEPPGGGALATGAISFQGRPIAVTVRTGRAEDDPPAWPVAARLESDGAIVSVEGHIARPMEGRGYTFSIDGSVPEPGDFAALLPRLPLRSVKGLTVRAEVTDNGGSAPALTSLAANLSSIDLSAYANGVRLDDVTLRAQGKDPLQVSARLGLDGDDSGITGSLGDLAWLTSDRSGPVALDLSWNAASARGEVKGTIEAPRRFEGFALDVSLDVPDPSLVLANAPPALRAVAFQAHLSDASGPVPFTLTSNAGDLSGELSVSRTARLNVDGRVVSRHLDLDMLALPAAASAPAVSGSEGSGPDGAPEEAPPPAPAGSGPLISDRKLPFGVIRAADANVTFALASVHAGGTDVGAMNAVLSMKDGLLRLDPVTVTAADRRFSAGLTIDAAAAPPAVHLTLDAPNLALGSVLTAFGLPPAATGTLEARADLSARGDSPRALAATLNGRVGLAVQGGQLDAKLVNSWLERLRPLRIDGADVTGLRCFALRADAKSGVVTVDPFALDTAALILEGSGDIDLGRETVGLRLRPRAKIGGTGIALPLRVSGPMRDPSTKVDISSSGLGGKGFAGLLLGGKDIMGAAGGGDPCPDALARARDQDLVVPLAGGRK
jgi:AsmA protein